jgi:hypothetical protein
MVKRICSTVETTKQRLGDLRHHLKRRGYNDKVIESGVSKASEINKEKKINKRIPLVLTYHPSLEKISGIVRHHWKDIEKREMLAKLYPEPPVVAFRQPKSIKDTLVRAAVSRPSSTVGQCNPSCNNVIPVTNLCLGRATTRSHSSQWSKKKKVAVET